MTTITAQQMIEAKIADSLTRPHKYDASGTAYFHAVKVINGHMVETYAVGWASEQVFVNVDRSTERLTVRQAADLIAA